ncbi:MAG TPA: hypothetical protein VNH40_00275 [Gaiellaceae bacterium]|nr:hypothetical protein [Gaiellaceae bacterium]
MPVHDQIAELLSRPPTGDGAPTLAAVEETLTEGYAQALALEAERWRLERSLGDVAREAHNGDAVEVAKKLAGLSERLTTATGELARLRALLARLHDRARQLRGTHGSAQGSPPSALAEQARG